MKVDETVRRLVLLQPLRDSTAPQLCRLQFVHSALRFYEQSYKASGQYAKAFETVCNEMAGDLFKARPCFLEASSGQGEQSGLKMWNGEEVVEVAEEELRSPQLLDATTPAAELHAGAAHDRLLDES